DTVTVLDKGDLVKTGYTFAGWNTAADGSGTDHAVGSIFIMGSSDVTLYAKWATNTYTVTFNSQGGSAVSSQTVEHGGKVTKPTNPTRIGYTFDGWYKESGCINAWVFATDTVTANVTLYAKWTAIDYTVTFNKNDTAATGTMTDQTIASGSSANLTSCAFTKTGWTFAGWATTPSGTVIYADGASYTMGTANVILYAKWTPLYALRDTGPAGGLIFYVKEGGYSDGWMYLEAAPSDQSDGTQWGSYGSLIGGTETGIGTGQSNTTTIVTWLDNNTDDTYGDVTNKTDRAAYLCDALTLGVYSDWFLPSKDELNLMYTNLEDAGVGGFTTWYWSSSEFSADNVYVQYFVSGGQGTQPKNATSIRVRAVRAF
ncbi:MAG: hypothetical protein CVV48_17235, partial [Spirochaetae bacterium HGW-Spirochaetae-4]